MLYNSHCHGSEGKAQPGPKHSPSDGALRPEPSPHRRRGCRTAPRSPPLAGLPRLAASAHSLREDRPLHTQRARPAGSRGGGTTAAEAAAAPRRPSPARRPLRPTEASPSPHAALALGPAHVRASSPPPPGETIL